MARRLSITRARVRPESLRIYLDASELYRGAAHEAGGHFWLFADDRAANTYFEFREAADVEGLEAIETTARSLDSDAARALVSSCESREAIATCREVPSSSS